MDHTRTDLNELEQSLRSEKPKHGSILIGNYRVENHGLNIDVVDATTGRCRGHYGRLDHALQHVLDLTVRDGMQPDGLLTYTIGMIHNAKLAIEAAVRK